MPKFHHLYSGFSSRRSTAVRIGGTIIGNGHPIAPQSMTSCPTSDTAACVEQIRKIHAAGCNIVRLAVQGKQEAENLKDIKEAVGKAGLEEVALVADIHFSPQVALLAAEYADKIRINPGNFGDPGEKLSVLLKKCREREIPIRIGVNHGSLSPRIIEK